jgi:formylglycine-generating enzyme required for sulfatase activity
VGNAQGVLRQYLKDELARLRGNGQALAHAALEELVTSQGTKAVKTGDELAQALAVNRSELVPILERLVRARLLRALEWEKGTTAYELAHECLIAEITLSPEALARKEAEELLHREMESWRSPLKKLIDPAALELIHERRNDLRRLDAAELGLIFRSALAAGLEVAYWFKRARDSGVVMTAILREGLSSPQPNTRAEAAGHLGDPGMAEAVPRLAEALDDDYPHVRARARAALQRIGTERAQQTLRDHPPQGTIYVPAGEFIMGDDQGESDEKPAHRVYVDAFYIAKYPVTNAEYARFVECTGRRPPDHWSQGQIPPGKENHPVVNVTWYEARDYAEWAGMRLLAEAEWEKAASWEPPPGPATHPLRPARGMEGERKRRYPWGDEFDPSRCNTHESGIGDTTAVGSYSPRGDSPYGCADMAGNVMEWTSSLYQDYPYRVDDGREDPFSSDLRVERGGSRDSNSRGARVAGRFTNGPYVRLSNIGFRVGWSAPSSPLSGSTDAQSEDEATDQ